METVTKKETTLDRITDLNNLILNGKILEGIDKYYDDEVVMQENENAPTVGKAANRKREEIFLDNIVEFRGARVNSVAVGKDITMVEWQFDYTHKEWGVRNYTQVSVQHWKGDKIQKEQFFYGS